MIVEPASELTRELEERLRFETLLADLSLRFVNTPANDVDQEIQAAQRAICECLDLDHSSFWQVSQDDPKLLVLTHVQRDPAMSPAPRLVGRDSFPWAQAKIMANEIVSIPDIAALPQEAVKDMESWRQYGVQSALGIPLSVGGGPVIGMLSFDAVRQKRAWPEPLQKRLQLIAQVFANALDRKRAEQKLRNRQPANGLAGPSLSPSTNLFQRPRGKMIDTTILHCHIVGKLGADLGVV